LESTSFAQGLVVLLAVDLLSCRDLVLDSSSLHLSSKYQNYFEQLGCLLSFFHGFEFLDVLESFLWHLSYWKFVLL
jgi:hypothetical protein